MAVTTLRSTAAHRVGIYTAALLLAAFAGGPLYWLLATSLKRRREIFASPPHLVPHALTFGNYATVFNSSTVRFLVNSIYVCLGATVMCVVLALLATYTLTRTGARGRRPVLVAVLVSQLLPQAVLLIPLYRTADRFGLLNSYFGLMIAYLTFTLPVAMWLLRSFFMAIPADLEEAARVDGLSEFRAFWQISVPLAKPGIAAVAAYVYFMSWQDFMYALVFLTDQSKQTLPLGMLGYIGSHTIEWGQLMAVSAILLAPIIVLFSFVQRYMIAGLTVGAVKG
jgi:ABC-type glycerol-3-phosphate transport system permease component